MLYWYLLFFFVTVGAKLVMALVMIYYLLPNDRSCAECDGETLLLGGSRGARFRTRLFLGRVQWRWCPRCGWEGMSRRVRERETESRERPAPAAPSTQRKDWE